MSKLSLAKARGTLDEAFDNLPALAEKLEHPEPEPASMNLTARPEEVVWSLALDEIQETGVELRPRLPFAGHSYRTAPSSHVRTCLGRRQGKAFVGDVQTARSRSAPSVADEKELFLNIASEENLPPFIASGLKKLYS